MLFRTKFVFAVSFLACIAIGAASLLIVSARQNEIQQTRIVLAYESLSGYLRLSGSVFRTFKQARRDLFSGNGTFAFDFDQARFDIFQTLDALDTLALREAQSSPKDKDEDVLPELVLLRETLKRAFVDIEEASELIQLGSLEDGRAQAIGVLEKQVDVALNELIEAGASRERLALQLAQSDIERANRLSLNIATALAFLALGVSAFVVVVLSRRFSTGLQKLEVGASEFATDHLTYEIDLPGQDELSTLAASFNGMAAQIRTKRDALETSQKDLEHRVQERTNELSDVNAQLRERDELRRQFFADIGHELRTPVTAIRGEAEVAMRSRTDKEANYRDALERIVTLSEQLTSYVTDLFIIAREQAGVLDYRTSPVDLNQVARQCADEMRSLLADQDAVFELALPAQNVWILGDASRLVQLVRILITNALDHSDKGVRICVSVLTEGKGATLSVSDTGPGLPIEDQTRLFDRYFKGAQKDKSASSTGLGLAIAKSIVNSHAGVISARQRSPTGAVFLAQFDRLEAGNPL